MISSYHLYQSLQILLFSEPSAYSCQIKHLACERTANSVFSDLTWMPANKITRGIASFSCHLYHLANLMGAAGVVWLLADHCDGGLCGFITLFEKTSSYSSYQITSCWLFRSVQKILAFKKKLPTSYKKICAIPLTCLTVCVYDSSSPLQFNTEQMRYRFWPTYIDVLNFKVCFTLIFQIEVMGSPSLQQIKVIMCSAVLLHSSNISGPTQRLSSPQKPFLVRLQHLEQLK